MNISYMDFGLKPVVFDCPYKCPSSFANCARELFKPSKDSTSLLVCTRKKCLVGGCGFFVSDVNEVDFKPFRLILPGLGPNC